MFVPTKIQKLPASACWLGSLEDIKIPFCRHYMTPTQTMQKIMGKSLKITIPSFFRPWPFDSPNGGHLKPPKGHSEEPGPLI